MATQAVIQTDEYGQPVLDDQGNPVQIAAPQQPPAAAPATPPTLVNRGGQPYQGTPIQPPTGQGRMYMGPKMSQSDESAFMLSPPGTRTNLMPPPTPQQAAAAQAGGVESNQAALARQQRVDAPGSRTIGVNNAPAPDLSEEVMAMAQRMGVPLRDATAAVKASQQFQATSARAAMIKSLTDQGVPEPEAVRLANDKYGLLIANGYKGSGMTAYQQAETKMRQQQLDQQKARANRIIPPKATPAVVMQFKSLLAQETQATVDRDPQRANQARWAKAAFIKEHPELGLSAGVGASPAEQGKPVKDKNGKTWVYTGTAADPKTDKNPAHWKSE